jgi:hypothetical protein
MENPPDPAADARPAAPAAPAPPAERPLADGSASPAPADAAGPICTAWGFRYGPDDYVIVHS